VGLLVFIWPDVWLSQRILFLLGRQRLAWRQAIAVLRGRYFCEVSCFGTQAAVRVVCCYLVLINSTVLNTGLCVSAFVSFICNLSLPILYMPYFLIEFKCSNDVRCISTVSQLVQCLVCGLRCQQHIPERDSEAVTIESQQSSSLKDKTVHLGMAS
jgi:hypothetical protein